MVYIYVYVYLMIFSHNNLIMAISVCVYALISLVMISSLGAKFLQALNNLMCLVDVCYFFPQNHKVTSSNHYWFSTVVCKKYTGISCTHLPSLSLICYIFEQVQNRELKISRGVVQLLYNAIIQDTGLI